MAEGRQPTLGLGPAGTAAGSQAEAPSESLGMPSAPLGVPSAPLAERMRPRTLDEIRGQGHLLGPDRPLRALLERGQPQSMILWGPPGVGKTTLARLLASYLGAHFVGLSAVTAGVKDVRQVAAAAAERRRAGHRTLLFLDEVHRFNKAQQDLLLPFVEDGTLVLVGATTENPSFEVNRALLSRSQVFVLHPLGDADLVALLARALDHPDGLAGAVDVDPEALTLIAGYAGGDARRALNALEFAVAVGEERRLGADDVRRVLQRAGSAIDKGGEHFYNLISALHKSVRGSDPNAALYWLARMLDGGADPLYLARRLVRIASEDVGLADPNALRLALAARDAAQFLGPPEGDLALAQAAVYLALAPKSNSIYEAWKAAQDTVRRHPELEVPAHLRNAPTRLMRELGYGRAYAYYFDDPEGSLAQPYLPAEIADASFFRPGAEGWETKVSSRLEQLRAARRRAREARGDET